MIPTTEPQKLEDRIAELERALTVMLRARADPTNAELPPQVIVIWPDDLILIAAATIGLVAVILAWRHA